MKTLGERIRQAREAKGWSGEYLAKKVGYKTQSGISNLESRATGSGGNKIGLIAAALNVSLEWLMNGPDSDKVPFLQPQSPLAVGVPYTTSVEEPQARLFTVPDRRKQYDEWTMAAIQIMSKLDPQQKLAMVAKMREFQQFLGPPRDGQTLFVAG